jgi:hypothetical protein
LGFGAFCQRKLAQGKKSKQDNWVEKFGISFNKFLIGVYVQMNYQASGKQVAPMERAMGLSDEVIRYLTLKLDRVVAPPCRFISLNGNSPLSYHRSGGGRGRHLRGRLII